MLKERIELIDRMLNFDESAIFDGYPSMTEIDICLIHEATQGNPVTTLACLASDYAETPEQYANARRYFEAYVENIWDCNMIEGSNKVYERLTSDNEV